MCAHEEMHRPLPHRASLTSSRRASHEKNRPPRTRRPSTGASGRRRSIRVARAKSGSCPPILRTDPSGRSAGSHGVACVRNAADDQLRWAGPRIRRRWRRERGWRPGRPQPGIETGHQGGVFPSTGLVEGRSHRSGWLRDAVAGLDSRRDRGANADQYGHGSHGDPHGA